MQKRKGLIFQVALFFFISILAVGVFVYLSQRMLSDGSVRKQAGGIASQIADETTLALTEYPAYEWLIRYWHDHAKELDIEYDANYTQGSVTEEKCRLLAAEYPDIQLRYADEQDIARMNGADRKLYAEIAYSWLITRMDEIKRAHGVDYLFVVMAKEPYNTQFFLLSAADEGAVRGTDYEEVYTLGVTVDVTESQQKAMREALHNNSYFSDAGDYVDYYAYVDEVGGYDLLVGMTDNFSALHRDIRNRTLKGTYLAQVYHLFLAILCLALIYAYVLRPLKKVQQNIRLYKNTKDSKTVVAELVKVHPRNEIGELSEDMIGLAREMDDYVDRIKVITTEKERVSTELSMATQIQESMLPNIYPAFPDRPEFDIYATMDPAREVGGDFYDFFLVDDDHLCMVMADVSGKGVPAALFMMASKIILQNNAMMGKSPAQILSDTNAAICSNNKMEMFVTVWLGILEISTGKLAAANAGHEYPAIKRAGGGFELFKDKHGFVIGGMEGVKYKEYEMALSPGDKLFVYTDGVPEAADSGDNMFGVERMLEALNTEADASPQQVLINVRSAVDGFVNDAEQFDDLTMLCMEYKGEAETNGNPFELEIEATVENLPQVAEFVDRHLEAAKCPVKAQIQIDVAVEEIFVNIANYAYAPGKGMTTVRMSVQDDPAVITITFIDRGVPYDPLAKEDPDVTLSAEDREIGGLGVYMTKKTMDDVRYEYADGCNILTMVKRF